MSEATWEPEENTTCFDAIADFERSLRKVQVFAKIFCSFFCCVQKKIARPERATEEELQVDRIVGVVEEFGERFFLVCAR